MVTDNTESWGLTGANYEAGRMLSIPASWHFVYTGKLVGEEDYTLIRPFLYACSSNPARLCDFVFCIIFLRCVSTVRKLIWSVSAILSFVSPLASSCKIS